MSIRKHQIAYLALFIALGGTSYAATQTPPNSVGTDQLSFPLGMTSVNPPTQRVRASCTRGRRCVVGGAPLAIARVSLKKSSRVLVLFHAGIVKYGSRVLTSPLALQSSPPGRRVRYRVGTGLTRVSYSDVITLPAGSHLGIAVLGYFTAPGTTRPPRTFLRVYNPQLTVIALPQLP